jgi:hypothetical protein
VRLQTIRLHLQDDSDNGSGSPDPHAYAGSSSGTTPGFRIVLIPLLNSSIRLAPPAGEGTITHISSISALSFGCAVDVYFAGFWHPAVVTKSTGQGVWVMLLGKRCLAGTDSVWRSVLLAFIHSGRLSTWTAGKAKTQASAVVQ